MRFRFPGFFHFAKTLPPPSQGRQGALTHDVDGDQGYAEYAQAIYEASGSAGAGSGGAGQGGFSTEGGLSATGRGWRGDALEAQEVQRVLELSKGTDADTPSEEDKLLQELEAARGPRSIQEGDEKCLEQKALLVAERNVVGRSGMEGLRDVGKDAHLYHAQGDAVSAVSGCPGPLALGALLRPGDAAAAEAAPPPPEDAKNEIWDKASLVQHIKIIQRQGEVQRERWRTYCRVQGGTCYDPDRHEATVLQRFIDGMEGVRPALSWRPRSPQPKEQAGSLPPIASRLPEHRRPVHEPPPDQLTAH